MGRAVDAFTRRCVLRRQRNKCAGCHSELDVCDIDHMVPYRVCQKHLLNNLQALCPTCHARKTRAEAGALAIYARCEKTQSRRMCWICKRVVSLFFGFRDGACAECQNGCVRSNSLPAKIPR